MLRRGMLVAVATWNFFISAAVCVAQQFGVQETWAKITSTGPSSSSDSNKLIAVDPESGDVYVAGQETLAGDQKAIGVWKYNSCGILMWQQSWATFGVNGNFYPTAIAFKKTVLGDAGPDGVLRMVAVTGAGVTGTTGLDFVTIAYNTRTSDPIWPGAVAKIYNDPEAKLDDVAVDVAIDGAGSVYVVGNSSGKLTSLDIVTIKYPHAEASPDTWTRRFFYFEETGIEQAADIFLVAQPVNPTSGVPNVFNGVYIVGSVTNTLGNRDMLTLVYGLDGAERSKVSWDGGQEDFGQSIFVENIALPVAPGDPIPPPDPVTFITGASRTGNPDRWRYTTTAYAMSTGGVGAIIFSYRWAVTPIRFYDNNATGGKHIPRNMTVALADGLDQWQVYVTGESWGGTNAFDCATVFYEASTGGPGPVRRVDGQNEDRGMAIVADPLGRVYVVGASNNGLNVDYFTVKYNGNGSDGWNNVPQGVIRYPAAGGLGDDRASSVGVFAPFCQAPINPCNVYGPTCRCDSGDRACVFTLGRTTTTFGVRYGLVKYHQTIP